MTQLETLLDQAANFEQTEDYEKLATVYREIAKIFYKQNNKEKNEEYLQKSKEAKSKIAIKETKINISQEDELNQIVALADSENKLQLLENFVNKYKNYSRGYLELAEILQKLNYFEKAKENYEIFIKLHDKTDKEILSIVYNNFAILLKNDYFKEYDLAKKYYEKAIELNTKYADAHSNLALLLTNDYFKEYDLAKKYYEKAIELNTKYAEAHNHFAVLLQNDYFKEYEKVKEYYEKAIELNPKLASGYNNFAFLLQNDYFKDYEKAKNYYEKAIELNPKYSIAYNNLALLLKNDYFKNYELAKKYYKKAIELNPRFVNAYNNLAILYYNNFNDLENAQQNFLKAIEIDYSFENAQKGLAFVSNFDKETFISKFDIKKVRHHNNFEIKLSETEKKHLFITGKNGCGKTSVLKSVEDYMQNILDFPLNEIFTERGKREFWLDTTDSYALKFDVKHNLTSLRLKYESGNFIVVFFNDERKLQPLVPTFIEKIELNVKNLPKLDLSKDLIKYLVYQDYKTAKIKGKDKIEIDKFFEKIINILKLIYKDENLVFDSGIANDELDFYITLSNGNKFNFNQLAAGYSAIFKIIFEIILRTQKTNSKTDTEGIILIDEPETHLHVEMQKEIMPILVKLFPRIQFVVATHSPFILSSLSNAVIYDLEKKISFEDATKFSYNGLIESYFGSNQYSNIVLEDLKEYEKLVNKHIANEKLTISETNRMEKLRIQFETMPSFLSKELSIKFNQIELKRLNND